MSADTLSDVEAAHLRGVRDDLGWPCNPRITTRLVHRGFLDAPTGIGGFELTASGREALVRHEGEADA